MSQRPPRQSSEDVRHVVERVSGDKKKRRCTDCGRVGYAGNVYDHVRKRHPHLVKSIPQPETAGIASFLATLSHVALVCIIAAVSMVPLGLLFGKVLRPVWAALGVRIPCASTVEAHSATMLRCITARRARWMRKAKVVHISLDVWSKRGRSILGVLATVVGEDNTSRIFPIGYVDAPQRKTIVEMLAAVKRICKDCPEWTTFIADGARNNPPNAIRCAPHAMHRMLMADGRQPGLLGGNAVLMNLIKKLDGLAVRGGFGLPRRSDVRWAGAHRQIVAALAKREAIGSALTPDEWLLLEDLHSVLSAFLHATCTLEANTATVCDVAPTMTELQCQLQAIAAKTKTVAMNTALTRFLAGSFPVRLANLVSPHHRLARGLSFGVSPSERACLRDGAVLACALAIAQAQVPRSTPTPPAAGAMMTAEEYLAMSSDSALAFDGRTLEQRLMAEIDEFIRQPHLCGKSGAPLSAEEALSMWTAKAATFPLLSRIAVITRTTPASTAPLERAFSGLSYLLSAPTRSRMKTETANRKLLIRAWAMEQLAATSKDQLEEEEAEDADAEGARGRGGGEARAGAAVGCGADGRGGAGAAVGCGADAEDDGDDGIEYGDSDADE